MDLSFESHKKLRREPSVSKIEKSQLERFKEASRQLETDDDEERFNERLKKLAKQKPDREGGDQ